MGRRTHGPHLLVAIDNNDHNKVHEILTLQVKNKVKIKEICLSELKRLASENTDCPLMLAAVLPDPAIIKYMVTKHGIDINFIHQKGQGKRLKLHTALMLAVKKELYQTVEVLLELNANTNLQDHKGRTALHHAVYNANYRMAKMLLTKGAQPNLTDKFENSALHVATRYGHLELTKLLMQYRGDLYKRGQYGAIPLHIAAKEGHISLIEWFTQQGCSVNVKIPCYAEMREKTPLHVACEEGHIEAVLTLVQKCNADVNVADSEGETPLHCSVLHEYDPFGMKSKDDYADTVLVLLKSGADPNNKNERGETALHHAARNEFQKVVELLIRAGIDVMVEDHDRNKAIDLVSNDDAVTKNMLKRAINDREKLMSELLEIKARGFSTSSQSLNMLHMMNSMNSPGPLSQSMMNIPNMGQGLTSRANSTSGLFLPDAMIYSQDGYLQPFATRNRMGSIGSQASLGIQSFAGLPLARQDSIGSFHSAMIPGGTYCTIDSDGVVSESAVTGVVAPRLIRKKKDKRGGFPNGPPNGMSSDSSQYDETPQKLRHSTPRRSASVDIVNKEHSRKAKKPKPFVIQPIGKSPKKKSKGFDRTDAQRQSQTSLNSQASTLSKSSSRSDASSLWEVTSYTSQSTLKADGEETSECNTSSRSTPDGCNTPRTLTDGHQSPCEDIYENVHDMRSESPAIYDNIGDDDVSPTSEKEIKPALPPRKRPLPPLPVESPPVKTPSPKSKPTKPLPSLPPQTTSPPASTPAKAPTEKRNSQEITIKISPHQSITIKTAANGQTEAIQVNSLLPEDCQDGHQSHDKTTDSDDSFFDDDSFETVSDLLDTDIRKSKPFPPPKPSYLKRRKATPEQVKRLMNDPKLRNWLQEQSDLVNSQKDKEDTPGGPLAHSTPPASRRELENRLRQAFGKPSLSEEELDKDDDYDADPRHVLPTPTKQHAIPKSAYHGLSSDDEIHNSKQKRSHHSIDKGDSVEYTEMNDLNDPGSSVIKPVPIRPGPRTPSLSSTSPGTNQSQQKPAKPQGQKWEKMELENNADTSANSLYWDHTEDIVPKRKAKVEKRNSSEIPETVYMEMRSPVEPRKPHPKPPPTGGQEAFRQQLEDRLHVQQPQVIIPPEEPKMVKTQPLATVQVAPTQNQDPEDWEDDDSFDSFESDSDDEGVPNSCHQVARHFKSNPSNPEELSNLVLATSAGDIVPHTRHSSTNARCIGLPGAGEIARRNSGKTPTSPSKIRKPSFSNPSQPKNEIVVVQGAVQVNGLPLNQKSPAVLRRSSSIQDDRNSQLLSSIKQSPNVNMGPKLGSPTQQSPAGVLPRSPSGASLGSTSSRTFNGNGDGSSPTSSISDTPSTQKQRRVTIGSEEIKLISDQEKLPRDHDHRHITYDTKGKMRITIIGGNSDGIFVHRIDPGSDAEQQGLMEGDQILKIDNGSTVGKTKEEVMLQLMSMQKDVSLVVRHKKDRYDGIVQNGGMGDSFFVKAFFNHNTNHKGELKIHEGDIFSVRDTLPSGRMGSWQALKVNAKPNEAQHGIIPNQSRAEQVALAAVKDRGRGIEKENRGSFIRRSLRRSKSAERLHKENEAFTKTQVPQLEDVKTYERVEQRAPGFLRPVVILGLFCDTVRDRILQELPGLYEKPPPEVEIPTVAEAGDAFKVPVDVRLIQSIISKNRHPLMIMSPRSIQYLQTNTKLYPIVIYMTPGSKNVVKSLRHSLAPGFAKRSSYMYEESQAFSRSYSHLFTGTVTYTSDDSWYALLKDTIQRIQNQPLWQPAQNLSDRDSLSEHSPTDSPQVSPSNKLPRLASSAREIPDPIRNILQRHAGSPDSPQSKRDSTDVGAVRPITTLTYDGYFLSENQQSDKRRSPGPKRSGISAYSNGVAKSLDDLQGQRTPKSILKNRDSDPMNGHMSFDERSPPKQYQQIGLVVPVPSGKRPPEENNNGFQHHPTPQQHQQQQQQQQYMQQQMLQQRMMQQQQAAQQNMLIQQMFQQQFMQQDPRVSHYQQGQLQGQIAEQGHHPARSRGRTESIETDL